jgi:hypothetical protein
MKPLPEPDNPWVLVAAGAVLVLIALALGHAGVPGRTRLSSKDRGMKRLLNLLDPYRWLAAVVAFALILGGLLWYRHSLIEEGRQRAEQAAATARAEAQERVDAQSRNMQEVVDESRERYTKQMADLDRMVSGLHELRGRLRAQADLAAINASTSIASLRDYAADAERDIDWCAERLVRTGETAAGASAAAHALYAGWPAYADFRTRLQTFTDQLKGQQP